MKNNKLNAPDDRSLDMKLRPQTWERYHGQHEIKRALRILIDAAKKREEPIEHILLHGPSGLGKTTLAHLIANEIGTNIKVTSGPAIEKVGDLAAILTNLTPNDILFIDEAHRLNKLIEEVLYPAMENRTLDIIIGKGPSARTIQLELPPFTLIAATTRIALLSAPLRSRFSGGAFRLNFYTPEDIQNIVRQSAKILSAAIEESAINEIVKRSRSTPRIANRLLKRCRDLAQVRNLTSITPACVDETFELLHIDNVGLEPIDRHIIKLIIEKFNGGPVGLQTIAASMQEASDTIEEVYEPYLLQMGFLQRTPRGRIVSEAAYKHLGLIPPQNQQELL